MGCFDDDREGKRCDEWHCGLNTDGYCTHKPTRKRKTYEQGYADAIEELLSKCEQYNYTCNSREFAKVIREKREKETQSK